MNFFDIVLTLLVVFGVIFGLWKGMARIAVGIAALVVAFFLASRFQEALGSRLVRMGVHETPARVAAYLLIFVATMIAGSLVGWLLSRLLKLALLGWADRLAGAALGLTAAVLAAAFVIHPIVSSSSFGRRLLGQSRLAPYVAAVGDVVNKAAPADIADRYAKEIESIRKIWRGEVEPRLPGAQAPAKPKG